MANKNKSYKDEERVKRDLYISVDGKKVRLTKKEYETYPFNSRYNIVKEE